MIIPREEALFRLDKNGIWYTETGRFEHPKIIRHFNESIQKDEMGYHLFQTREGILEKVYFSYEDTALFAIDIKEEEGLTLVLNTRKSLILPPGHLFTWNDNLYVMNPDHCIKFTPRALVKLSPFLEEKDDRLYLRLGGMLYDIPENSSYTPGCSAQHV